MNHERVMRRALLIAAIFNFAAAAMVLLPDSVGRLADVPQTVPRFFSWLLALFIVLFGGVYVWLARRPVIDRPMVVIAIVGKAGVFIVASACLLLGDISAKAFIPAVGDLVFGLIFLWWLRSTAHQDTSSRIGQRVSQP